MKFGHTAKNLAVKNLAKEDIRLFYIIAVLQQRINLSHPEEKFIHQFPQNMEWVWPTTPLFKKGRGREIWEHSFQALLAP